MHSSDAKQALVVAVTVVLLLPFGSAAQIATADLERIPAADVDLPQSQPEDDLAPNTTKRVCFESGRYVLALRAADGFPAAAAIGFEEEGDPREDTVYGIALFIGSDHAQRWAWGSFVARSGTCHDLTVLGSGARTRAYRMRVGVTW